MSDHERKRRKRRHRTETLVEMRPNRSIFLLLLSIPILATVAYGGTAEWAMMFIAPLTAILGCIWLVHSWRRSEFTVSTDPILYPVVALLAFAFFQLLPFGSSGVSGDLLGISASNAISIDPYSTRIFAARLAGYVIFFAAALTFIDSEKRLRKLVAAIAIFGGAIAFAGIIQWQASPDAIYGIRPTPQAIPFGPYVNRHHFASLMVLFSGVILAHIFSPAVKRERMLLMGISIVLMAVAVVLTGSRGGVLAYFAMLAICVIALFQRKEGGINLPVAGGIVAALVLTIGLVVFLGGADPLLRSFGLQNSTEDISSGRLHFWSVAWQVFTANPILGAGFEAFGVAYTQFDTRNGVFRTEQAHNDYLQMLADGGLLGFAIICWFVALIVKKGMAAISRGRNDFQRVTQVGAFAGSVGILVHSFFDFPLRTASNAFFFLLVLAILSVDFSGEKDRDAIIEREL